MSNIGKYLEFSVRTDDILESLSFYKLLGFTERETSDAWGHKYAVISDGVLSIGLHEREFDSPALTFVKPDLTTRARKMSDGGIDFSYLQLGDEAFNELRFSDRDRNPVMMVEARTYTGNEDEDNDSVLGTWFELSLPSRDAVRGAHFWAPLAPVVLNVREEPTVHMRFDAGGVPVGLSESIALRGPSLCFRCTDRTALDNACEQHGFELDMYPGYEGAFAVLHSPEDIDLYLFDEDFLGEGIVVEESGDLSAFKDIVSD